MDYSPEAIAQALSGGPTPTLGAQGKFNRIIDALISGARNTIETPGRAMQEGITTDQAASWAAPMALGMVGAPAAPAGAVGSGLTHALRTGDNAAIEAMRIAARERAERGGSTVRVYDTQRQLDASRGLTEADQGAEKAKAGWQTARNSALDDFRAAIAGEREPSAVPREYEPDPFSASPHYPANTDVYPPRDLTGKQQMSLADLLSKYGVSSIAALPPAVQLALQQENDQMMPPNGMPPGAMPPPGMQPPVPTQPPGGIPQGQMPIDPQQLAQLLMAQGQGGGVPGGPPAMGGPPGMPPQGAPMPPQPPMMGPAGQGQLRRY